MHTTVLGIDTTKLTPLANLVQRLTGVLVPTNKAIVGSGLYQIESGIIASWFKNCGEKNATELFPSHAEFRDVARATLGRTQAAAE